MTIIRKTDGLCPVCRAVVPAEAIEEGGSVYLEKDCPVHGRRRDRIARSASIYRGVIDFYALLERHFPPRVSEVESCALTATLRCNLSCAICFAADGGREAPAEPTLPRIEKLLDPIRGRGIMVRITGGEPTLRDDLPEIVARVKESGNHPVLISNAVKLADAGYLASLRKAGLWGIAPWLDSVGDEAVYLRMRKRPFVEQRRAVLAAARALGLKLFVFFVCVKGFNDHELAGVLALGRDHPHLVKTILMPYMHRGARGFSEGEEYALDEFWEAAAAPLGLSLEELIVLFQVFLVVRALRGRYTCFNSPFLLVRRSLRREDGFDPDYYRAVLDRFRDLLRTGPGPARRYFLRVFGADLLRRGFGPPLLRRLLFSKRDMAECFIPAGYVWIQFQHLFHPPNFDRELIRKYCCYYSLNAGLEQRVSFCEYYNLKLKT
jgi:MoaA/NifB/PqqE/SkfB family radical SAM enzyme